MKERFHIKSTAYVWAIKRAGLTVDDYMEKHKDLKVSEWISMESCPTFKQLEKFAASVCVPIGYLFLETPPVETVAIPMFRGNAQSVAFDVNVYDTVNDILRRQDWVSDYIRDNEIDHCDFVGSMRNATSVAEIVSRMRSALELDEMWASQCRTQDEAVRRLAAQIENSLVFVFFNGVVGNNTRRTLSVSKCRGFSLSDDYAPCIFVNNSDSKTAQMFTLIHELCHIFRGESEGGAGDYGMPVSEEENICDKVAAEFLVPMRKLRELWDANGVNGISNLAKVFKVSELVVIRRAYDLRLIPSEEYRALYLKSKNSQSSSKTGSGGDFYKTSIKRVGRMFASFVLSAKRNGRLTNSDAYRLTGLYGSTFDKFMTNNL